MLQVINGSKETEPGLKPAAVPGSAGLAALPPQRSHQPSSAPTVEEITANATAADIILEQAQLDKLTALQAGDEDS
jgi:hypothetical protein